MQSTRDTHSKGLKKCDALIRFLKYVINVTQIQILLFTLPSCGQIAENTSLKR